MIRIWGGPLQQNPWAPAALLGLFCFIPSALQACFGHKPKNPLPSLRSEEDFVEVGGGFDPPYPVVPTDA